MKALFLRQGFDWVQESPEIAPKGMEVSHIDLTMAESFDDQRLSDLAEELIQPHEPDVLVIPVFLGNPTDYNGFRLAMHVRLTQAPGFNQPHIVLLASESNDEFQRHCPYIRLLQTQKVTYIDYDHAVITRHLEELNLGNEEYRLDKNLHHFDIIKPDADDDHHNLDGKLALLSWSEAIGCIDELNHLSGRFGTQLHFKEAASTLSQDVRASARAATTFAKDQHKILLIDDQVEDGWLIFFRSLFSNTQVDFSHLDFSNLSNDSEEILMRASEKVYETDPDVVILDLRLCDSDFERTGQELTGLRVLKKIKEFNKGIQVIVLSASNKIWNLKPAYDLGAREGVAKDPNDRYSLVQLITAIDKSCRCCRFFKEAYLQLKNVQKLLQEDRNTSDQFKRHAENCLLVAYELVEKSEVTPNFMNYAYLHLYKLMENWVAEYTESINDYTEKIDNRIFRIIKAHPITVVKGKESQISYDKKAREYKKKTDVNFEQRLDVNFKMSALLIYLYHQGGREWSAVNTTRNRKCGHASRDKKNDDVTISEFSTLMSFFSLIFNAGNQAGAMSDAEINDAHNKFHSKKIQALRNKFNSK